MKSPTPSSLFTRKFRGIRLAGSRGGGHSNFFRSSAWFSSGESSYREQKWPSLWGNITFLSYLREKASSFIKCCRCFAYSSWLCREIAILAAKCFRRRVKGKRSWKREVFGKTSLLWMVRKEKSSCWCNIEKPEFVKECSLIISKLWAPNDRIFIGS